MKKLSIIPKKDLVCYLDIAYEDYSRYDSSKINFEETKIPIDSNIALGLNTGDFINFEYEGEHFEVKLEYKWLDMKEENINTLLLSCILK